MMNRDNWCIFESISTNETHPYFQPSFPDPSKVERISFKNSKMPLLTNEMCLAFPNLKQLDPVECSLKRIEDGALSSCHNLFAFKIWSNVVTEINPNLFMTNPDMIYILFSSNKLTHINVTMFERTKKLEILDLNNNFLVHLDVGRMQKLEKLRSLSINVNNLLDLDENGVVNKFPNLKSLHMEGNLFECRNLEVMIKVFKGKSVDLKELHNYRRPRPSAYNIRKINDIECLDRDGYFKAVLDVFEEVKTSQDNSCHAVLGSDDASNLRITVSILTSSGLILFCIALLIWHGFQSRKSLKINSEEMNQNPSIYMPTAYYETTMRFRESAYGPGPSRWEYKGKSLAV